MTNPFQTPAEISRPPSLLATVSLPVLVTGLAIIVGGVVQSLQNGQVFTNGLICIGLFGISGVFWALLAWTRPQARRLALVLVAIHAAVLVALVFTLPSKRAFQDRFNAKMEAIRSRRAQ
jgi:hypothetical protein